MKNFDALTWKGKTRRMRSLVQHALMEYDIPVTRIRYMGWYTNLLYRLDTENGKKYVLRICAENWRTDTDLLSEVEWLTFLQKDGQIQAPVPVFTKNGDALIRCSAPGIPEPKRVMVMSYIPGKRLSTDLREENLFKMGVLFAKIHQTSLRFSPSASFTKRQMDQLFPRGEPQVLFTEAVLNLLPQETKSVYLEIKNRVEEAYQIRYANSNGLRVIHHDLWHDNIHIYRGNLYPLDFEDTVWGYPIQDIAMAMLDLMDDVPAESYQLLLDAFQSGYESLTSWPALYDSEMNLFCLGRMLWVANYVALKEREHFVNFSQKQEKRFRNFLSTGRLTKNGR